MLRGKAKSSVDVGPSETSAARRRSPANGKQSKSIVDLSIPAIHFKTVKIRIKGTSPLIMHKFSTKSKTQMAEKQQGKAVNKRPPKDPKAEFLAAIHYMPGSKTKYGFPASGFKKAAVSACRYVEGISMAHAQGSFHVLGDFVELKTKKPRMREDTVRIGGFGKQTTDLRYRPEFETWSCELVIKYNTSAITPEQIAHLLNVAGFAVGVGEWRPEKKGAFGMFEVA